MNEKNDEARSVSDGEKPKHIAGIMHALRSADRPKKDVTGRKTEMKRCKAGDVVRKLSNKTKCPHDDGNKKPS